MRLDINLERMVIHRNILLQVSRGNILDAEIIGPWTNKRCYTGVWGQYIRCRIIGLWNGDCCYIGIWGDISDEVFSSVE